MNSWSAAPFPRAAAVVCREKFREFVIPQLIAWREAGLGAALVTLTGVEGSSPRPIGSQLAVNARLEVCGSISHGCAEGAIIAQAVDCISRNTIVTERYGARSRFFDVRLPCGSGIDIHIDPTISLEQLRTISAATAMRRTASLHLFRNGKVQSQLLGFTPADADVYVRRYLPPLRIVIFGRGYAVRYLAELARGLEFEVVIASPDRDELRGMSALADVTMHLRQPSDFDISVVDARTAIVTLFHDHDWEPELLAMCQRRNPFYIGALGSRRAHEKRKEGLRASGCSPSFVEAVRGPVGLPIGAMNPPELAISIIGEILAERRALPD